MSLDQVRTASKSAGSLRGPVKQGPTTYNVRTRDLAFQIELDQNGSAYQYNTWALNPRHLRETDHSGPLYDPLLKPLVRQTLMGKSCQLWSGRRRRFRDRL